MYYLKGIKAKNLFSWKELNIVFKNNEAYSLKGENGSGKSSVFEIIIWVFFKKTTKKNVKGNYGKDDGYGKIMLSDGNNDYCIERHTDIPMQILMNGKNVTQEYLESFIGGNYSVFMASNMCSQKRVASFINESSDSGKAKIFGEMLGCAVLDNVRTKTQKKKSQYEVEYESACAKVQTLEETLEGYALDMDGETIEEYQDEYQHLTEQFAELFKKQKEVENDYDKALKVNRSWESYEKEKELIETQETNLKLYQKELDKATEEASQFNIEELNVEKEALAKKSDKYHNKANDIIVDRRAAQSRLTKMKNILELGGACPTCGNEITKEHRSHIESEIEVLKNSISEKLNEAEKYLKLHKKYSDNLKSIILNIQQALSAFQIQELKLQNVKSIRDNISIMKKNLRVPKQSKKDTEILLNKSRNLAFKVGELGREIEVRGKVLKGYYRAFSHLEKARTIRDKKEKVYSVYSWLFKHIPLMKLRYINDNKIALEDIINEYISSMGLPFLVKIETQKELKSTKEVKEAFSFQIVSTIRKHKADKKDLSGGEETCILLSTQFGISDIAGTNLDFEIYDEIYGSLDNKNLASVIEALLCRVRDKGKQLFSISHKDEISHSFPNIIEVENKDGYSRTQR